MTTNIDRAAEIIGQHVKCGWSICERRRRSEDGKLPPLDACGNTNPSCRDVAEGIAQALADAGLLMPDIPDGLNLIGFERKGGGGGGGGLLWDDRITTEALTKGYTAMFARLDNKEKHDQDD